MIEIVVCDGRAGRLGGPAGVNDQRDGEVLMTVNRDTPIDIGNKLTLPDGTVVEVIGVRDNVELGPGQLPVLIQQVVSVGSVWDENAGK